MMQTIKFHVVAKGQHTDQSDNDCYDKNRHHKLPFSLLGMSSYQLQQHQHCMIYDIKHRYKYS